MNAKKDRPNVGKFYEGVVEGYGSHGDPVVDPDNYSKKIFVKDVADGVSSHAFVGDKVRMLITSEAEKVMFGELTEVIHKKPEKKWRLLLDIADLFDLDKDKFSVQEHEGVEIPSSIKKAGLRRIFITSLNLFRDYYYLRNKVSYLEEQLDKEKNRW